MSRKPAPEGTQWCQQCKDWRPEALFLRIGKGYRVRYCDPCAQENMARYWRYVEMDAGKVSGRGVDT